MVSFRHSINAQEVRQDYQEMLKVCLTGLSLARRHAHPMFLEHFQNILPDFLNAH